MEEAKKIIDSKSGLHSRNKHRDRYNFEVLISTLPELEKFVSQNKYEEDTIDFANPLAVITLNKALLKHNYNIIRWEIPTGYLCPPIPGRADYIHNIADLLASCNINKIPKGSLIKCLDIGVGANCIYPIIGTKEYGWSFVGSDTDTVAVQSAKTIINHNEFLIDKIDIRTQTNSNNFFKGIIQKDEYFDITICNPPFHASVGEAKKGTLRKLRNLSNKRVTKQTLNFGGQNSELWCAGGEKNFIHNMIQQSREYSKACFWFSTLVSKESNLKNIYKALLNVNVETFKTLEMSHGNKVSRIVAWTFLDVEEQKNWRNTKWKDLD